MAKDEAYRRAEQKIEKARRSGAKKLDLSRMELTELPEALGQLTQLDSLCVPYNKLKVLPESLGQLTQLKLLDLAFNKLTMILESLGQLKQLHSLHLSYNLLVDLPSSLAAIQDLKTFMLDGNPLNPELAAADKEGSTPSNATCARRRKRRWC